MATYAFRSLHDYTTDPRPFDVKFMRDVLTRNSPGSAVSAAPVYSYHANGDELVPVSVHEALVAQCCATGDRVQVVRYPGGSHITTLLAGAPGAVDFLAARFGGTDLVDDCN
ncbi:lipase family protein [Rhodococcus opacus]|uniref:lipase family protein n=1 Tax=Rhodococcus opacus TaxID=37919 RepID=UPI0034D2E0DE